MLTKCPNLEMGGAHFVSPFSLGCQRRSFLSFGDGQFMSNVSFFNQRDATKLQKTHYLCRLNCVLSKQSSYTIMHPMLDQKYMLQLPSILPIKELYISKYESKRSIITNVIWAMMDTAMLISKR